MVYEEQAYLMAEFYDLVTKKQMKDYYNFRMESNPKALNAKAKNSAIK